MLKVLQIGRLEMGVKVRYQCGIVLKNIKIQKYHISADIGLMLSSLRNYSRNIAQSERFYYDNYDYYNIYENLEKDYKDDLSKFIYHSSRRTTPYIVTYAELVRFKHSRLTRNEEEYRTMEDFINQFILVYMENNYLIPSRSLERDVNIQPFQLHFFSPISDLKYQNCPFKMFLLSKEELAACINMLIETNKMKIQLLQQEYSYVEDEEHMNLNISNVEFNYSMELYSDKALSENYQDVDSQSFLLLFQFVVEVHRLMWEIMNSRMRTILLMSQPKTYFINLVVHPLILPITTFLKYGHAEMQKESAAQSPSLYKLISMAEEKKPRIVFINLDGRETTHNLRSISTLGEQILYISLYEEPSWLEKKDTQMNNLFNSEDQNFQPSYSKLWDIFSQAIIKQFKEVTSNSKSKILLFPLNSKYIYKSYLRQKFQSNPSGIYQKHHHCPKLQSSHDIHSLFEQLIYQQVRAYKPTMIFLSYNGQLNILEDHFNDIIRNCSIIADYRVVLFANFTHFFEKEEMNLGEDQEQADKILCIHQFYQKYLEYKLEDINQQRMFGNLSGFLKYGPGLYSMQDRVFGSPSMKYNIDKFYKYLQMLSKMNEFKSIQKYSIKKWNSQQLSALYESYLHWQIKQNRKENKYYDNLLSVVVAEFLCKNISQSQLENILGKKLFYRFRFLIEELVKEQEEIRNVFAEMAGENQIGDAKEGVMRLLEDYLEIEKEKLLAENLENYKIKKYFYLAENQKSFGQVSCFKFVLGSNTKQSEQIYLQKYSQIIINEQYEQIFIINYKSADNHHLILNGSIKNSQIQRQVMVTQVQETDLEQNEEMNTSLEQVYLNEEGLINQKQDILFVQYNYCINDRVLYLYWPLMWNLKEEARYKLLGLDYKPKRVWKMIKVSQYQQYSEFRFENLRYDPSQMEIEVLPRWGCSSYPISSNVFHIFGGVFESENDYKMIGSGVHIAEIKDNGKNKSFSIRAMPKQVNKTVGTCLRPKINYTIRFIDDKNQQNCLKLSGGYGREMTGFFNIFSYEQYYLDNALYPMRVFDSKITRRIVNTEKPLQCNKIGKFNVILNNYNISQMQQKFSDVPKDKFIFEKRIQSGNKANEWELLAFIDETYKVNQFKTDPKKLFLFGFDRTVRQKIFLRCWSPELYFVDGVKDYIVNLSLKTEKTSSYVITNYLMPREEDIVSLCLEEDKLYLLSNSPIIHSIDRTGLKFVFYEGYLANMNEVMRKKQIQMIPKHNFDEKCEKFLAEKTIFVHDQRIYLVGGYSVQIEGMETKWQRQDYVLQTGKNRFKIKTRKLESNQTNLQMPSSVVIKENEYFLLYSLIFEQNPTGADLKEGIEWKIKIERFSYQNNEVSRVKIGGFQTYTHNSQNAQKIQRYEHSNVDQPKFVRILPYKRFNLAAVREVVSKIVWRMQKNECPENKYEGIQIIRRYHNETDDKQLSSMLERQWNEYQQVLNNIKNKTDQNAESNLSEQELLIDLKHLYELITKMVIERHLYLQEPQPNEHIFVVEDKSSRKVKYIAVGPLNVTKLNFFRIRFKYELSVNLNQHVDQALFYHPTVSAYYRFEDESLRVGNSTEYKCEDVVKNIKVVIKQ